jgi:hypothetical protein
MSTTNRNVNLSNVTLAAGSVLNTGDKVSISNVINQLPAAQDELKALLEQLAALLKDVPLPDREQADVLAQTEIIVQEAELASTAAAPSRVLRALRNIREIYQEVSSFPGLQEKLADLSEKISQYFSGN